LLLLTRYIIEQGPGTLHAHRLSGSDEVLIVDIEDRLKRLQALFSYALSGAVAAKARYLACRADLSLTPAAVARAKMTWQQLEARKTAIIARMVALEELEEQGAPDRLAMLEQDAA
jgi:hypothetical protein